MKKLIMNLSVIALLFCLATNVGFGQCESLEIISQDFFVVEANYASCGKIVLTLETLFPAGEPYSYKADWTNPNQTITTEWKDLKRYNQTNYINSPHGFFAWEIPTTGAMARITISGDTCETILEIPLEGLGYDCPDPPEGFGAINIPDEVTEACSNTNYTWALDINSGLKGGFVGYAEHDILRTSIKIEGDVEILSSRITTVPYYPSDIPAPLLEITGELQGDSLVFEGGEFFFRSTHFEYLTPQGFEVHLEIGDGDGELIIDSNVFEFRDPLIETKGTSRLIIGNPGYPELCENVQAYSPVVSQRYCNETSVYVPIGGIGDRYVAISDPNEDIVWNDWVECGSFGVNLQIDADFTSGEYLFSVAAGNCEPKEFTIPIDLTPNEDVLYIKNTITTSYVSEDSIEVAWTSNIPQEFLLAYKPDGSGEAIEIDGYETYISNRRTGAITLALEEEGVYTFTMLNTLQECSLSTSTTYCKSPLIATFLEGAYDPITGEMTTALNQRGLLPGQTPVSPLVTPTPAGQPYNTAPWNYTGTEGIDWTDADYTGNEVDWVLVSFRTDTGKNTEVAKTAALLMKDGSIEFPDRCILASNVASPLYIVVEHRNHIGVMTPQPVTLTGSTLSYDFRTSDSYRDPTSYGQKQLPDGTWAMFAGDADQSDFPSYDITGADKFPWVDTNGQFDQYLPADFNLDGDVSGGDKILWFENNGISSRVPR